jgi:hypothetical protein
VVGVVVVAAAAAVWGFSSRSPEPAGPQPITLEAPAEPTTTTEPPAAVPPSDLVSAWTPVPLRDDGYVSAVAAGAGGWLAVSAGDGMQAHTSPDGAAWITRHLASGSSMSVTNSAVAGERLVVTGIDALTDRGWSWVSDDEGASWQTIPVTDTAVALSSVAEVNREVFTTGRAITAPLGLGSLEGSAAAFWLDGSAWRPLSFTEPPLDPSVVTTMIEADGFTLAVGYDRLGLAVWRLRGTELVEVSVAGGDGVYPQAVVAGPDGSFIATDMVSGGAVVSTDLFDWQPMDGARFASYVRIGAELVGVGSDRLTVTGGDGPPAPVEQVMGPITAIGSNRAGQAVVAAVDEETFGAVLWLHGIPGSGSVTTTGYGTVWATAISVADAVIGDSRAQPPVARAGDLVLIAVGGRVAIAPFDDPTRLQVTGTPASGFLDTAGDDVWAIVGSTMRRLTGDDLSQWDTVELGTNLTSGALVSGPEGRVVVGWTPDGWFTSLTETSEGWDEVRTSAPFRVRAVTGGFLGTSIGSSEVVFSVNGIDWVPAEASNVDLAGARLAARPVGDPFLILEQDGDGAVIGLVGGWPEVEIVRVPTTFPEQVLVVDDEIRVLGGALFGITTDGGVSWALYPASPAEGAPPYATLLPTVAPAMVAVSGDILSVHTVAGQ